jgi:hypothetical protein
MAARNLAPNAAMRSNQRMVCASLVAIVAGCAPAHTAATLFAARPAPAPETLTIAVASDLRWPVRAQGVLLALDGARVTADAPLRVPAGLHTVSVRAELRWPCAVAGSDAIARITHSRSFETGARGAELRIAILSLGTIFDIPERRFVLRTSLVGDARNAEAAPLRDPWPTEEQRACAALSESEAALCRVRALVRASRERRDLVDFTCKNSKLRELEAIAHATAIAPLTVEQRTRIQALEREALGCSGGAPAIGRPLVELVRACEGEAEDASSSW